MCPYKLWARWQSNSILNCVKDNPTSPWHKIVLDSVSAFIFSATGGLPDIAAKHYRAGHYVSVPDPEYLCRFASALNKMQL